MPEIKKGIKAGWVSVEKSTLGGDENVAIMIKLTLEPEKDWPNNILQNARFGMIRIGTNGEMEMFASHRNLKNMRRTKIKSAKDVVQKINIWIKKVDEGIIEFSSFTDYLAEGRPKIVDKIAMRANDEDNIKRGKAQQKKYKPEEVINIARKHRVKIDPDTLQGYGDGDWNIDIRGGITLAYNYYLNQTHIDGWKVDKKKIRTYINKYEQGGSEYQDLLLRNKLYVNGFESAFELIGEQVELEEAAPANKTGVNVVGTGDDPTVWVKKKKRINAKVKWEDFGGTRVYIVPNERWHASRLGKNRYAKYEKYIGNDKLGETIRLYGRENPKSPIILKNEENGAMLYLKYGGSKRTW